MSVNGVIALAFVPYLFYMFFVADREGGGSHSPAPFGAGGCDLKIASGAWIDVRALAAS